MVTTIKKIMRKVDLFALIMVAIYNREWRIKVYEGESSLSKLYFLVDLKYKRSTFSLAQGVFRKKVRLDFIEGSLLKQLMLIFNPNFSQP